MDLSLVPAKLAVKSFSDLKCGVFVLESKSWNLLMILNVSYRQSVTLNELHICVALDKQHFLTSVTYVQMRLHYDFCRLF